MMCNGVCLKGKVDTFQTVLRPMLLRLEPLLQRQV